MYSFVPSPVHFSAPNKMVDGSGAGYKGTISRDETEIKRQKRDLHVCHGAKKVTSINSTTPNQQNQWGINFSREMHQHV